MGPFRRIVIPATWRSDILAGMSLAFTNIPQVLGYARIAAMPAVTGLYTVLLPLAGFALFGSSRHLVVAADSATAAILSGSLSALAPIGSAHYITLVSATALTVAGLLLVARLFRLGFLADFLSRTVLVGFMTGVGAQIMIAMLHELMGVQSNARTPLRQLIQTFGNLHQANGLSICLAAATIGIIFLLNRFSPRFPAALCVVVGSIALSKYTRLSDLGVSTLGPVSGGLPHFGVPLIAWSEFVSLLPIAASCVFVIITQSAATSRSFATQFNEPLDENKDLEGLWIANTAAALCGTFTVNGSPTQTAMAVRSGAHSQIAQLTFSALTLLVLLFFTGPLQYLPQCVLAAIVFMVAIGMVEIRALLAIRRESPGEFWLALTTAIVVLVSGVEQGILLAIALSLFRHVRHSYAPHTAVLQPFGTNGALESVPAKGGLETQPGLIVFRFCADLFYANSARFSRDILTLVNDAPHPVRCIVVECSPVTDIDYSAAEDLRSLLQNLNLRGVRMFFGRVSPDLKADMNRHRLIGVIGIENLFEELHTALASARQWLSQSEQSSAAP